MRFLKRIKSNEELQAEVTNLVKLLEEKPSAPFWEEALWKQRLDAAKILTHHLDIRYRLSKKIS